ncbi:elongator complex protein 4 isoform X2 [Parasteatoda tepidariorum]|uniref:elongator complex protein 4 isoform X2 n=1 Tax=Parasteatoda tepidariorum TaxID=114398 RepID=UPI0039BC542B
MSISAPRAFTSFRKKGADIKSIPGTRVSTHNAQLLTSTGLSTLDFFIGGGLPVGTICLIEEDKHDIASKTIMKYFLSEAVIQNHKVFLSSGGRTTSEKLLKELPAAKTIEVKHQSNDKKFAPDEVMKIAIQYQNQPPVQDAYLKVSYHNQGFDLSKRMSEDLLHQCSLSVWDPTENCESEKIPYFLSNPYSQLLETIKSYIVTSGLKVPSKTCQTVMKIGICSLGSPLWYKDDEKCQETQILRFLYLLKALIRTSYAVALITIPFYLTQNKSLLSKIRQTCDMVISFESFEGTELADHPAFQEYAGLIHMTKLPVLNSCQYPVKTTDLAYKTKRKEFIIERLHLPPDFDDNSSETIAAGCGGPCSSKLDY